MSYEGFVAGDLLSQHRTALDFNLFDRHALKSPQLGGNPWPIFYTNLRDNDIILNQSRTTNAFKVYEGPALILKAYMAAGLTDLFGDVPYFEAFNGTTTTVTPSYDNQEDIYLNEGGILDNLDKGIIAIENYTDAIALEGDEKIAKQADHVIYIPKTEKYLAPLLAVMPLQLLAYYAALVRGCDVDKPRNLAKSVTVE